MALAICMVMLSEDVGPDPAELKRELDEMWPELPAGDVGVEESTFAFSLGEAEVMVGRMPVALPWTDLEGPCATSILWPDAAADVRGHQAHLLVTVRAEVDPVTLSGLLTRATAAILSACPQAIGVYWGNATLIIPNELFVELATDSLPEELPIPLWVDTRVWREHGKLEGFTTGLAALGHREVETTQAPGEPGDLREMFYSLAEYVISSGKTIADGDTVGGSEEERILVTYADSAFGIKGQVMRLDFEVA